MIKLKNILNEQQRETVNLYLDYENKKPLMRVAFVKPEKVDQLPKSLKVVNIEVVEPKTDETYELTWEFKSPKYMLLKRKAGVVHGGGVEKVYNKNLTRKLYNWYKSTINSPNATYAQTNQPEQPNELT